MARRVDSISQMQTEDEAEIDLTPMLDVVLLDHDNGLAACTDVM